MAAMPPSASGLSCADAAGFAHIQRVATMWAASDLVPKEFKNNIPNCVIALEMANRMRVNALAVFQNLYIVHGKPGWSSQFITAAINSTKKFSPLRFRMSGTEGQDDWGCVAWARDETGEELTSPKITISMAKKEGWFGKTGSKWQTMPELMLRYRAATFFGRLYAPEVLMGMQAKEEIEDVEFVEKPASQGLPTGQRVTFAKPVTVVEPAPVEGEVIDEQPAPTDPPKAATAGVASEATMLQIEDFIRDNAIPQSKVQDEVKNVGAKKFSALTESQACAMQSNLERFVNSPSGD